ncbi:MULTISPECIES: cache domain-containing sensor histidine kinase [unclassified Paenibacillus]|uniref:cache domain-containing sensor histidine kinase n=1 Tax=unclassified Paenibacillus TaxID=185978 RepID=UPI0036396754
MKTKINELVTYNLIQTNKNLDASLSEYDDTLYQLIVDKDFIRPIEKLLHGTDFDKLFYSEALQKLFSGYSNSKEGIRGITFLDNNGDSLVSYDKIIGSPWNSKKDAAPYLLKLNNLQQGPLITVTERVKIDGGKDDNVFHIARKVFGISSGQLEIMGYLIMDLDESILSKASSISLMDNQADGITSVNFLIDATRNIVSFPEKKKIGTSFLNLLNTKVSPLENLPQQAVVMGQSSIINYYPNEQTGWTIVNVTSEDKMFSEIYSMQKINIWTAIAVFSFSILLIIYFSGLLTQSIRKIVNAMQLAEQGNLNVKLEDNAGDEISIIASSYNKMMTTINELMEETKIAVQKQKESEIRSLEAQINPHFLYNTLDSINWMAIDKDEHEISRMLKGLALILRYSVSYSNQMVLLAQELEWLEQYLFLQKNRFNDAFQYYIHIDPELKEAKIYKLLLQPFVENTIIHGFAGMKTGAELHIRFFIWNESFLCVEIEDNGCGMDETVLKGMMESETKGTATSFGIGVRNVMERLQLYYGDQAHCSIESTWGQGTKVSIIVPLLKGGNA